MDIGEEILKFILDSRTAEGKDSPLPLTRAKVTSKACWAEKERGKMKQNVALYYNSYFL